MVEVCLAFCSRKLESDTLISDFRHFRHLLHLFNRSPVQYSSQSTGLGPESELIIAFNQYNYGIFAQQTSNPVSARKDLVKQKHESEKGNFDCTSTVPTNIKQR